MMTADRIARLNAHLLANKLDALVLNPGPSLTYLTGMHFHLMERPVAALFAADGRSALILPELEIAKAQHLPFSPQVFTFNDNPSTWADVYRTACSSLSLDGAVIGMEPTRLRVLEYDFFKAAMARAHFRSGQACLDELRMRKDTAEISAMRQAVVIAQQGLAATLPYVRQGMTERELASELVMQLLRAGSDPSLPFSPIVSSGPNSANPHAVPTDRMLAAGDMLVFDWGAGYKDYFSDLTRTYAIGRLDKEMAVIAKTVLDANAAGRAAARPGISAGTIDHAARHVIEQAGYGVYFTHRTGHGLGMEAHEEPYIYAANEMKLAEGMTFTVEPGIYLPGIGGVRIEDNLVITASGFESLSDMPRPVEVIG
jgi:Xaa-Pro dipeptidase